MSAKERIGGSTWTRTLPELAFSFSDFVIFDVFELAVFHIVRFVTFILQFPLFKITHVIVIYFFSTCAKIFSRFALKSRMGVMAAHADEKTEMKERIDYTSYISTIW